jgi:hypothetical protein
MNEFPLAPIVTAFVILIAITLAAQFRWLPDGRPRTVLVFLAGVAIVVSLRIGGVPPWWFDGEAGGFGLALSLLLGGFVSDRTFGRPLLYAMSLVLFVLNVAAHV